MNPYYILLIILLIVLIISGLIWRYFRILGMKVRKNAHYSAEGIEDDRMSFKQLSIPMSDGFTLAVYRYDPKSVPSTGITIVTTHGFHGSALGGDDVKLAKILVSAGHTIFAYDSRLHGNSGAQEYCDFPPDYLPKAMLADPKEVLRFIKTQPGVDPKKMVMVGFSYGGTIGLTGMIDDPDIRMIITGCALYDFNELWIYQRKHAAFPIWWGTAQIFFNKRPYSFYIKTFTQVSPKLHIERYHRMVTDNKLPKKVFYISHCQDDAIVPFHINFPLIKAALGISDENCQIFPSGGHGFKGNHHALAIKIVDWIQTEFASESTRPKP